MLLRHGAASPQGDPSQRSRKLFPAFGQIVSHLGLALSLGQLMGPSPISSTENVQAAQLLYCHTADSPPTFGGTEETFTSLPSPFWNKAAACISPQDWDQQRHCSWHNWFSLSLFSPARNSKSQQTPPPQPSLTPVGAESRKQKGLQPGLPLGWTEGEVSIWRGPGMQRGSTAPRGHWHFHPIWLQPC